MDLQTRKLNLITYLAQLQDEGLFAKIEELIQSQGSSKSKSLKIFTEKELIKRAEKANRDYANGAVISHEDLEALSSNW